MYLQYVSTLERPSENIDSYFEYLNSSRSCQLFFLFLGAFSLRLMPHRHRGNHILWHHYQALLANHGL